MTNYRREGGQVLVIEKATDAVYEQKLKREQRELEQTCIEERQKIMEKEPVLQGENTNYNRNVYRNDLISWRYSLQAKAFVEQNCEPPIAVVDREAMTESKRRWTRKCEDETQTRQFVCEQRKTNKEEMSLEEWEAIKVRYSYFRY